MLKVIVLLGVLVLAALPAGADQLGLGGDGTVYFCSSGPGQPIVLRQGTSCAGSAGGTMSSTNSGWAESPTGTTLVTWQPWSFGLPTFGWTLGLSGTFIPDGTETPRDFSWGGNSDPNPILNSGEIQGEITWTELQDGPNPPRLFGHLLITSNANLTGPLANYMAGQYYNIDYSFDLVPGLPDLEQVFSNCRPLASGGCEAVTETHTGGGSAGEITGTPEPGAVALLGAGLLVAGTYLRRKGRIQAA